MERESAQAPQRRESTIAKERRMVSLAKHFAGYYEKKVPGEPEEIRKGIFREFISLKNPGVSEET
jgi:hypothetical protein